MLYVLAVLLNQPEDADRHLRKMVEKGYFTPALIDYGYNMLVSADPGGIIITNGDNDTFPCLALQEFWGLRPDVTIANQSLMTLQPMARYFLTRAPAEFPPVLSVEDLNTIELNFLKNRAAYSYMLGNALIEFLCQKVSSGQLQRPLYLAVSTNQRAANTCGSSLLLQGLLQKVIPGKTGKPGPVTDVDRTFHLFKHEFRMDSATDFSTQWQHFPAQAQLMSNYSGILFRMGYAAIGEKDSAIMEYGFSEGLKIASFHKDQNTIDLIECYWDRSAAGHQQKLKK